MKKLFKKLREPSTKAAIVTLGLLAGSSVYQVEAAYSAVMMLAAGGVQLYEMVRKEKLD